MPAVIGTVGGWTETLERAEAAAPGWTSVLGTSWDWTYLLSWWLVGFVAYATRIELITKVFIARDAHLARFALLSLLARYRAGPSPQPSVTSAPTDNVTLIMSFTSAAKRKPSPRWG